MPGTARRAQAERPVTFSAFPVLSHSLFESGSVGKTGMHREALGRPPQPGSLPPPGNKPALSFLSGGPHDPGSERRPERTRGRSLCRLNGCWRRTGFPLRIRDQRDPWSARHRIGQPSV